MGAYNGPTRGRSMAPPSPPMIQNLAFPSTSPPPPPPLGYAGHAPVTLVTPLPVPPPAPAGPVRQRGESISSTDSHSPIVVSAITYRSKCWPGCERAHARLGGEHIPRGICSARPGFGLCMSYTVDIPPPLNSFRSHELTSDGCRPCYPVRLPLLLLLPHEAVLRRGTAALPHKALATTRRLMGPWAVPTSILNHAIDNVSSDVV